MIAKKKRRARTNSSTKKRNDARRGLSRPIVVGIIVGAIALAGASLLVMPHVRAAFGPEATVTPIALTTAGEEKLPVIFLTATPFGFDQNQVRVPEGRYLLVVSNRTGIVDSQLDFSVATVPGAEQVLSRTVEPRGDYVEAIEFTRGEYSLAGPAHLQWQVQIVVE